MIPIGSQVRARVFPSEQFTNWLPKDAVLSLGMDKVVFLRTNGGFKTHRVVTGLSFKDQVQIVSGLNESDSVAANGQFLVDGEGFTKIKK